MNELIQMAFDRNLEQIEKHFKTHIVDLHIPIFIGFELKSGSYLDRQFQTVVKDACVTYLDYLEFHKPDFFKRDMVDLLDISDSEGNE